MDNNIELAWKKTVRDSEKAGFREGIIEGKSANFQENFDKGYHDGFRDAFSLGKIKGALRGNNLQVNDSNLEKTRRGNCLICKGEQSEDASLPHLRNTQEEKSTALIQNLYSTYSSNSVIPLENKNVDN